MPLDRRDVLRAGALGGLLVAAPSLFAGCSDGREEIDDSHMGDNLPEKTIRYVSSDLVRDTADPALVGAGAGAVLTLAGGLYERLVGSENLALSPFSAAVALGMTVNGAAGSTREEMLAVLGGTDVAAVDDGFNALTSYIESLAGPVPGEDDAEIALDSANRVFGQHDYPWRAEFLDALAGSYGAGVLEVDFAGATETARAAINTWTSQATHERITQIVPEGALDDLTRMVLVNALYFKAPWLEPFEKSATRDEEFHLADGSTASVPMMHGGASYSEGDGWRAAHLPYAGGTLTMTVALPDQGSESVVDTLIAGGDLAELLGPGSARVALTLPKWQFLVSAPLTDALAQLGMASAFDPARADFSAMTTEEALSLTAVLQQVFIAVDEAGTEAAAATAVVAGVTSAEVDPPEPLVLDRPFVFVIHDVEHGTPLFLGKVADPRS